VRVEIELDKLGSGI